MSLLYIYIYLVIILIKHTNTISVFSRINGLLKDNCDIKLNDDDKELLKYIWNSIFNVRHFINTKKMEYKNSNVDMSIFDNFKETV